MLRNECIIIYCGMFFPAFPPASHAYRICYENLIVPSGVVLVVSSWVLSIYFTIKGYIRKNNDVAIGFWFLSILMSGVFVAMAFGFIMSSAQICYPF